MYSNESSTLAFRLVERVVHRGTSNIPILARVATWLDLVELCQEVDRSISIVETPGGKELSFHRAILAYTVGKGEMLLDEVREQGIDLTPLGVDGSVLAASVQMLDDSLAMWHNELSPERREEVVREVFGVAA